MAAVIACPNCATENPPAARFCANCGAGLATAEGAVQERRVVTALFADLARSTALGESLDPEVVRGIVVRFYELARAEIERRGGTVEKFSGDAVMAVFGLPTTHEDDPERAVRAAVAIAEAMNGLASEMHERHGVALQARIGIEAGEVVTGDALAGATMATGDAMNVAARLEQRAEPGEIVIGGRVHAALRDMISAEPLGELELRGRDATVAGWRVLSITDEVGRPRGVPGLSAPLTGRDEELSLLLNSARRAAHERKALLFTILGVPGVGKSRLVREVIDRLTGERWRVVRGRCLPYGEGITYWPVAEMLRELADIAAGTSSDEAHGRLAAICPDDETVAPLWLALGMGEAGQGNVPGVDREIAWAFRQLVERLATDQPLVLVFEDIHWAEPALLDLIEYLVTWAREVPLLVICPSRPELLDSRPAWGAGRMESSRISLEPLTDEESRSLLAALLTVEDLPAELRQRVLDRAEGNPLFVEEVVRMLIDEGVVEHHEGRWIARREAAEVRVPETVEALIRARLDTLPAPERAALQAAAVVGRVFQHSAVATLAHSPASLDRDLEDAVLRDLITEERSADRERSFRFRHVLIRDVAYSTLPKARRAELHHGVADWLSDWAGDRIDEFVEIQAYHLEQAALLQRELDGRLGTDRRRPAVAALAAAAQKALARDDPRAARQFAERALALEPQADEGRLELRSLLAEALRRLEQFREAARLGAEVEREAVAAGRKDLQGRAILAQAGDIWVGLESPDPETALRQLERARELLSEAGDDAHLVRVLEWLGFGGWWRGQFAESEQIWNEERELARANGWPSREAQALLRLAVLARERGDFERRRQLVEEAERLAARGSSRRTLAAARAAKGGFLALSGSAAEAEPLLVQAARELEELGDAEAEAALSRLADMAMRDGRLHEALDYLRRVAEYVKEHAGRLPEAERAIARVLLELGQLDEAERYAEHAVEVTARDDWATVASTKMVLGRVREAQGRPDEAEKLLREAHQAIAPTDFNPWEEELALAEFLLRRGRLDEGREWLARARASAERFGPNSELIGYVDEQGARAEAAAAGGPAPKAGPPTR